MSKYILEVRGESVEIKFTRINDSRRIPSYQTKKSPNLFTTRGAMLCEMTLPPAFAPDWWVEKHPGKSIPASGCAFCFWGDRWNSAKGRRIALADALRFTECAGEIMSAFFTEEKRRTKVKGPATQPKKARPPKPYAPSIRESLAQIAVMLKAPSMIYGHDTGMEPVVPDYFFKAFRDSLRAGENVRPVDIAKEKE